jgi:uncharacterized circularly permuted ATP-grasp superfamily protein/uncharacterized alpha-E superfamily protein
VSSSPPQVKNAFDDYTPLAGVYDEFFTDARAARAHSDLFVESINRLGRKEFAHRWEQAQRLVHENGFAFTGNVAPKENARPWELDALPVLISPDDWQSVSAALQQRARVLNLVLRDLYGKQSLLQNGVLPPELVFSHPGFLRPYHALSPPHDCFLHFYAADLARAPGGNWRVLADRTEAPSGLGYALDNRIVISRMLPDVFHQCRVQRLAPFFIAAQEALRSLAPQHRENPRVALLSHGPTSTDYFEDAYLARYLGYTLVEGGDLAVRGGQVVLKTLGGLLPVDVIVRRQNSNDCDPLELGPTDRGIAGLTQTARAGSVSIANALGSGLVESIAFMAFMPKLCQELLGEELLMPGVATWWCGQPQALAHVLKNLDHLIVHPTFRRRGEDGPSREALNTMPAAKLAETIRSNPIAFAAQEKVARSSTPVWEPGLQPAHLALRAYLVAAGDSYLVMQGALARISSSTEPLEMSIRNGEASKDVWILSDGPVDHVSLLEEPGQAIALRRIGTELPSRSADNLFWLGRQLERAEASARLLRSVASRLTGETRSRSDLEVPVLLRCLADQGQIEPGYAVDKLRDQLPPIDQILPASVFDITNHGSLRCVIDQLFRLGSIVRDRMSHDTWRIIHRIDERFQPARFGTTNLSDLLELTDELIMGLVAVSGVVMESMTRALAFRFLELGRRLERSLQIIKVVKNCFLPLAEVHGPVLETVLEVADSLMTYRSRYRANLQLAAVLDLLLTDETNPRSLAYQFVQLAEHIEQLPREQTQPGYTSEQRLALSLLHATRLLDIQMVSEAHSLGDYDVLRRLLEGWESQLPRLSEAISHRYLVHAGPAHQLADIRPQ